MPSADVDSVKTDIFGKGREELVVELIAYAPVKELPYEDGDGDGELEKHADGVSRLSHVGGDGAEDGGNEDGEDRIADS